MMGESNLIKSHRLLGDTDSSFLKRKRSFDDLENKMGTLNSRNDGQLSMAIYSLKEVSP